MQNVNRQVWTSAEKECVKKKDLKLLPVKKVQYLEELRYHLFSQDKTGVFSINGQLFNYVQENPSYKKGNNINEYEWSNELHQAIEAGAINHSIKDKLNVKELMQEILKIINEEKMSIYCLGAGPGIAEKAAENINEAFPEIILAGTCNGFFFDKEQVFADIKQVKPDLLLIGTGVPFEDKWIFEYFDEFDATLIIAVGPYLDDISGMKKRASLLTKKIRPEWISHLWTLLRQ